MEGLCSANLLHPQTYGPCFQSFKLTLEAQNMLKKKKENIKKESKEKVVS